MPFVSLDTEFAQSLVNALDGIHETSTLDLSEDTQLHALLCELVGSLATQLGPNKWRRRPIDVESLLAEKYVEWDEQVDCDKKRSAQRVLSDTLDDHNRSWVDFQGGSSSDDARSFMWGLDDARGVERFQMQLNTMSDTAIDALTLVDLAHSLCIVDT